MDAKTLAENFRRLLALQAAEIERLNAELAALRDERDAPLTNVVTDAIAGYKAGLAGEPMGSVSAAFDCGWISGDHDRNVTRSGDK